MIAVSLGGALLAEVIRVIMGKDGLPYLGPTLSLVVIVVMAVPLLWPLVRGVKWSQLRWALGWHGGTGVAREAAWGLVGYVAGLPILLVGLLLTMALANVPGAQETPHPAVQEMAEGGLLTLIVVLAQAVVWAPLVEESLFRGAVFHHLRRRWGVAVSVLISGFLFASLHPQGWTAFPVLTSIGVVFALIREWRGSIVGSMVAHGLHNLLTLTFVFLMLR